MNNYISIQDKKYSTSATWEPSADKAMRYNITLKGEISVSYAAAEILMYSGQIRVNATENRTGYGTRAELEASLRVLGGISFTDHEGKTGTAHVKGWRRSSLTNQWDSPSNKFFYDVALVMKG